MEIKETTKPSRLSLEDFKMNKLDNKTEIDKLLGGVMMAASCHQISLSDTFGHLNDQFDDH